MINMCIKEMCILVHAGLLTPLAWPQIGTLALRLMALNCIRLIIALYLSTLYPLV